MYKFRDYLQVLMLNPAYIAADDETKKRMIKRTEDLFYEAALPILIAKPGNEELQQGYIDKQRIKQEQAIINRGR